MSGSRGWRSSSACLTAGACEVLLQRQSVPAAVVEHSDVVERVARRLAESLNETGMGLNVRLLEAAALLHDIARTGPDHAVRGAELLSAMGFPRVAAIVASHMDLSAGATADLGEKALLFLADKLVMGTRLVALPERLAAVEARLRG